MKTYYNEFDKKKCAALSCLMKDGFITKGEIDDRSIKDIKPEDVRGYDRCHFFAGIGLWDYALQLAGWPDERPVWTGSCPCQPFSSAGRQKGKADDRHLWPEWLRLIEECSPATVYGEQVASAIAHGWLDDVYQGMEQEGYAVGSVVLPACSVGAPHRRERLWFVAKSSSEGFQDGRGSSLLRSAQEPEFERSSGCDVANSESIGSNKRSKNHERCETGGFPREGAEFICNGDVGHAEHNGSHGGQVAGSNGASVFNDPQGQNGTGEFKGTGQSCDVAYPKLEQEHEKQQRPTENEREWTTNVFSGCGMDHWESGIWIDCPDGKQRLVEPGIPLLAHGYPERVGIIHCAGDAIVAQVAAEFIAATMS